MFKPRLDLSFVVALVMAVLASATSHAETNAPQLTGLRLSPNSVDVTSSGQTITFEIDATDDASGITQACLTLNYPLGGEVFSECGAITAGSNLSGTFSGSGTIPQGSAAGVYTYSVMLEDVDENSEIWNYEELIEDDLGGQLEVEVISVSDTTPPELLDFSITSSATIDVSSSLQRVYFSFQYSDDLSGFSSASIQLTGSKNYGGGFGVQGDAHAGTQTGYVVVPQYAPAGTYCFVVTLYDNIANRKSWSCSALAALGYAVEVTATAVPRISLSANSSTGLFSAVGDSLSYTYSITNTGNVTFSDPVTISDSIASASCEPLTNLGNGNSVFEPGEAITCTGTYAITQADLIAGSVTNTATASAGGTTSNSASVAVDGTAIALLDLAVSTTTATYRFVGDTIDYSYLITNIGNLPLVDPVTVTDDMSDDESCPALSTTGNLDSNLDPGESLICTGTHLVTQGDIDAEAVTNSVIALADGVQSGPDGVTVDVTLVSALALLVETSTESYRSVRDTIDYTYTITNSGNQSLAGPMIVADDRTTAICPALDTIGNNDGSLDPGEIVICTGSPYGITPADLKAGSVTNSAAATADSIASNSAGVTVERNNAHIVRRTREAIENFLQMRADLLQSNGPERGRFIRDLAAFGQLGNGGTNRPAEPVQFAFVADNRSTEFDFATSLSQLGLATKPDPSSIGPASSNKARWDAWVEVHESSWSTDTDEQSGTFAVAYIGSHYIFSPSLLVGGMAQLDYTDESSKDDLTSQTNGRGWMAGPYAAAHLTDNLYFFARYAQGKSRNELVQEGLPTEKFDTSRRLGEASLIGNLRSGAWRFSPEFTTSYYQETQETFTNSLDLEIPEQEVSFGQVSFGPEIGYTYKRASGSVLEPSLMVRAIWNYGYGEMNSGKEPMDFLKDSRLKITAGLDYRSANGWTARTAVSIDGIGLESTESIGAKLQMQKRF